MKFFGSSILSSVGIILFLLCGLPQQAVGHARFFIEANPAVFWTTVEPMASFDASLLGPEEYARYYARPSVLNLGLELTQGNVELVFRLDIRPDFLSFLTEQHNTNLPFLQHGLVSAIGDVNMPSVGYIDFSGKSLRFSVGRRALKWGPASYALAISDNAPYLDHLWIDYRFKTKKGAWWYSFIAISPDRAGQTWGNLSESSLGYKTIFAHKGGYESDFLRVSIGELNLVHDIAPSLLDMAPIASFHNLYQDIYSNVLLAAAGEFKAGAFRGFGEFVMDDLVMSWESWQARPTALGWSYGLEYRMLPGFAYEAGPFDEDAYARKEATFRQPGGLVLSYEHYRTTTYLYNRENVSGKWTIPDHRLVNASFGYIDTGEAFFLGFLYGPDVSLDMLGLSWESEKAKASFSLSYLQKGSYDIQSSYPPTDGASTWYGLQEPVSRNFIGKIYGAWAFTPSLQVWAQGEFWIGDRSKSVISAGCSYRFSTR